MRVSVSVCESERERYRERLGKMASLEGWQPDQEKVVYAYELLSDAQNPERQQSAKQVSVQSVSSAGVGGLQQLWSLCCTALK